MGPFENYTRYLALQLTTCNNAVRLINLFEFIKLSTIIFILLMLSLESPCTLSTSYSSIYNTRSWISTPVNDQVDNIASDAKDGSMYIVIDGDIFKYTNELKLLSGTKSSTSREVNGTTNSNRTSRDLINKILINYRLSNQELLFSCWHTKDHNLKCWLNKVNDLTAGIPLHWPIEIRGFKIHPNDNIKALVNQNDPNNLIVVASKTNHLYDDSSSIPYLPAISRFRIVKGNKHYNLEPRSVLSYKTHKNDSTLLYNYVYIFYYEHYTHFLLNEIQKPTDALNKATHHNVRLARICNNDTDLTSYTEISLTCNNQVNLNAKSAYTDTTKREPSLYVVFETLDETIAQKPNAKSLLCSYSLNLIGDMFHKVISDCNNGFEASNMLPKFYPTIDQAPLCQKNPSTDWCTSKTNPFIDGTSYRYNIKEDTSIDLGGMTAINFLYTAKQGPELKDVLFLGTDSGFLTKMSYDEELFFTIDLNRNDIKYYQIGEKFSARNLSNESESRSSIYCSNNRSILASTKDFIHQINIDACNYYRSCKACLTTRDHLECVWCGSSCSQKKDCTTEERSTTSCPPLIKDFNPKKGPIVGKTRLTILGENFGSSKGALSVRLDSHECLIDVASSTSEVIYCVTKPVEHPQSVNISILVDDRSDIIDSKGFSVASSQFSFVEVKLYGLYPATGPYTGGNAINVYGENLDAGVNWTVIIGNSECKVVRIQIDRISCIVQPSALVKAEAGKPQYLKMILDGLEQTVLPRHVGNLNLSTSYLFTNDQFIGEKETVVTEESNENELNTHNIYIIILILVVLSIVFLLFLCKDKVPDLKNKLSPVFEFGGDKTDDMKVTFRNPQSQKFAETNLNPDGNSINGLVKLNGSVMSNSDYFSHPDQLEPDQPLMNSFLDNEIVSLLVQEKILIDRGRLTLGHVLGSGQFGRVYKGFLKIDETGEHAAVAVKTLHNRSSWDDSLDNKAFLEEGLMMRDFEHDNVLALIGVTFDSSGLPMVITPFMLYGDLRSYISDEASSPTVKELIDFGTQVAKGMAYLSNLKFVHRDLAARNCMLDENLTVKVADFGLSRDIYERDYYSSDNKKTKLPVKWMAIESLEKCIYNTKTDVWSYGVLLWELMTRGVVPYPDVDNFDLFSYLKEGRRMLRPRYCPLILYKIMLSCWEENPAQRPTFDELVSKVSDVITQLKVAKDGQQKVSRDITYCDVLK